MCFVFFFSWASLTFWGFALMVGSSSMEPKNLNILNNNKQFFKNIYSTCTNHQIFFNITWYSHIQNFRSVTSLLSNSPISFHYPFAITTHILKKKTLLSCCLLSMCATASFALFFYFSDNACTLTILQTGCLIRTPFLVVL